VLVAVDQSSARRLLSIELSQHYAVIQVADFREAVAAIQQHDLAAVICNYGFGSQINPLELFHFARTRLPETRRVILADPVCAIEAHQSVTTGVANVYVGDVADSAVLKALQAFSRSADTARQTPRAMALGSTNVKVSGT